MKRNLKIYFHGDYRNSSGPSNANKNILSCADKRMLFLKSKNKIFKKAEYLLKVIFSDITVFSGVDVYAKIGIELIKKLNKKSVYLMHGCAEYEIEMNSMTIPQKNIDAEKYILENADLILCVSEKYAEWVKNYYPHLKEKISFVNSGINAFEKKKLKPYDERTISVAAAGGDLPQKNNQKLCQAISELNDENIVLNIYGKKEPENKNKFFKGELRQDLFFKELENTKLFVLNSTVESFSLAAADALERGCSILLSKDSGIRSILNLEDTDIIYDTENEEEIAGKISYLLENPNNERIKNTIDFEKVSWKKTAENLYKKCENLCK